MKSRYFLISLLGLSILTLSSIAYATTYSVGVEVGDKQTYLVKTLGEGYTSYNTVGNTFTLEVISIGDSSTQPSTHWGIYLKATGASETTLEYQLKKTPTFGIAYICPVDVATYLSEANALVGGQAEVSGRSAKWTDNGVYKELTWDEDGWMTSLKYTVAGEVVSELVETDTPAGGGATGTGIPGYDLPILLGISALFSVCLILLKKKRI